VRLIVARLTACLALLLCAATAFAQSGKTGLPWLGQAAFCLTTPSDKVIVIAPWLWTNPGTPAENKEHENWARST